VGRRMMRQRLRWATLLAVAALLICAVYAPAVLRKEDRDAPHDPEQKAGPGETPVETPPPQIPATLAGTGDDADRSAPAPESRPDVAAMLARYVLPPETFEWSARLKMNARHYTIYDLTFPSPVKTEYPENNTVHCELFRSHSKGKRPAVVVLHILDGRFLVARLVCMNLADAGLDAMLVKLPFYGPRRPADVRAPMRDPKFFELLIVQGVADTRRAAALLAGLDTTGEGRVDLCGVSLGGFVAALTAGVDGHFRRAAFVLAGGGLSEVLTTGARETRKLGKRFAELGLSGDRLKAFLAPIDPITFAHRLESCDVIMFNMTGDEVVPASSARALASAAGDKPIKWYEGDKHTAMLKYLLDVLSRNRRHFTRR